MFDSKQLLLLMLLQNFFGWKFKFYGSSNKFLMGIDMEYGCLKPQGLRFIKLGNNMCEFVTQMYDYMVKLFKKLAMSLLSDIDVI